MKRRTFIGGLAGGILAAPLVAEAQQAGKVYRIGWLAPARVPSDIATFRERLRALGWVDGQNVAIVERYAGANTERFPALAAELAGDQVDVIVTFGSAATAEVQKKTATIPVVFVTGVDPVRHGYVASLARPGKNLTGIAALTSVQVNVKLLEALRDAMPNLVRVGVFTQPHASQREALAVMDPAARALSMQIVPIPVMRPADIDDARSLVVRNRVEALVVPSSIYFHSEKNRFVNLAARMRLPAIYENRGFVEAGGLLSYGVDLREVVGRMAVKVSEILRGAHPGDLPIEQPTKFELVINMKTAKSLGLTIPRALLSRADHIIE